MTERPKTAPHVTFYFAYNSPYAFLANTRIEAALAPYDVTIVLKPVYTPRPAGQTPDLNSPRFLYIREDIGRFAEAYGLALDPGPFADSGKACRGFLFAEQEGAGKAYHDRLYGARWLEGKDIGDDATLAAIAAECGLDGAAFLAATSESSPQAAALARCNAEAENDGVFGFPF
jgi:2-hydroxychromene-2-carboxylate isomerase